MLCMYIMHSFLLQLPLSSFVIQIFHFLLLFHPRVYVSTFDTLMPRIESLSPCQDCINPRPSDYLSNMTPQRDAMVDETTKNRIFDLYIVQDLTMAKLRSRMKEKFDFDRT
jgi:hypothetical protein